MTGPALYVKDCNTTEQKFMYRACRQVNKTAIRFAIDDAAEDIAVLLARYGTFQSSCDIVIYTTSESNGQQTQGQIQWRLSQAMGVNRRVL